MARTLAEDIADDFTRVFLDTDHFAVTVAYTPFGGVQRSITVQLSGSNGGIHHDQNHLSDERVIVVECRRHATYGINDPQIRDKIVWEGTTYNFDAVAGESSSEFFLRFKAVDRTRTGNMTSFRM